MPERWGEGTWTPEKGYEDFLRRNIAMSDGQLKFEFNRYLGWPGRARRKDRPTALGGNPR